MMKNTISAICTAVLLAACSSLPEGAFELKGTVDGADGQTLYFGYQLPDRTAVADSVVIAGGKFRFAGNIDCPTMAYLYTGKPVWQSKTMYRFYLEPARMKISGLTADNFEAAVVAGSKTQDEVAALEKVVKPLEEEINALRAEMQSADESQRAELSARTNELHKQYTDAQMEFIKTHPASYHTASLLTVYASRLSFDELKSIYEGLTPEVREAAADTGREIAALEAVQPGKPAPDLVGVDHKGRPTRLSDLRGKVVLLDFWATWCGPCRASLPHVKALYDKYHAQGFEVFCVADNDSNPDQWAEFIVNSGTGMEKYHHILRGLKTVTDAGGRVTGFDRSNDQSEKYAVHYLPTKFLIAADGTIVGKMDADSELDSKLAEIFHK